MFTYYAILNSMPTSSAHKTKQKAMRTIKLLDQPRDLKYVVEELYGRPYSGEKCTRFMRDVFPHINRVVSVKHKMVPNLSKKGRKIEKEIERAKSSGDTRVLEKWKNFDVSLYQTKWKKFRKTRGKTISIDMGKILDVWKIEQMKIIKKSKAYGNAEKHPESFIRDLLKNKKFQCILIYYFIGGMDETLGIERILGEDFAISLIINKNTLQSKIGSRGDYEQVRHLADMIYYKDFLEENQMRVTNIFRALETAIRSKN